MKEIKNESLRKMIKDRERLSEKNFVNKGRWIWDLYSRGAMKWIPEDEVCDSLNSVNKERQREISEE